MKIDRTLLMKCCIAAALVIVLWILGYSFPLVAISVGAFILIIGRVKVAEHLSAAGLGTAAIFRVAVCRDPRIRGVGRRRIT